MLPPRPFLMMFSELENLRIVRRKGHSPNDKSLCKKNGAERLEAPK